MFNEENFVDFFRGSYLSWNIFNILKKLDTKTIVREQDYVDQDFLIDYSYYYSRSFDNVDKKTTRYHFFSESFDDKILDEYFLKYDDYVKHHLDSVYQGFIVKKPIEIDGNFLLGKSVLKAPDMKKTLGKASLLTDTYCVNLFGIPLTIHGMQFCSQDRSTSACATIALWTCNKHLHCLFKSPIDTPFEITKKAKSEFNNLYRDFPSNGLNIREIVHYLKLNHFEVDSYNYQSVFDDYWDKEKNQLKVPKETLKMTEYIISAYLTADIPIILGMEVLDVNNPDSSELHSVSITGFKKRANKLLLYLHDDRFGPYCEATLNKDLSITCDWEKVNSNCKVYLHSLVIPLYHKIRLDFKEIYQILGDFLNKNYKEKKFDLFLINSALYKQELLKINAIGLNLNLFRKQFPRYIWVFREIRNSGEIIDTIYDSTNNSTLPLTKFLVISYTFHDLSMAS